VNAGSVTDHAQLIGTDCGVPPPERVTYVVLLHAELHHDGPRILVDQEIEQKVVARLTGDPRCLGEGNALPPSVVLPDDRGHQHLVEVHARPRRALVAALDLGPDAVALIW
jgi:hypothetical protein